jgi:hypothetical protein
MRLALERHCYESSSAAAIELAGAAARYGSSGLARCSWCNERAAATIGHLNFALRCGSDQLQWLTLWFVLETRFLTERCRCSC